MIVFTGLQRGFEFCKADLGAFCTDCCGGLHPGPTAASLTASHVWPLQARGGNAATAQLAAGLNHHSLLISLHKAVLDDFLSVLLKCESN